MRATFPNCMVLCPLRNKTKAVDHINLKQNEAQSIRAQSTHKGVN